MPHHNNHKNYNTMKKASLLLIGLLTAAGIVQAQNITMEYIPHHAPDYPQFSVRNVMQQHDGNILTNIFPSFPNPEGSQFPPTYVGNVLYKVSPFTLQVSDSLLFADTINYFFYAKDPQGEGNLRISGEADGDSGAILRISHFSDDDLNIDPSEDVIVPLYEVNGYDLTFHYLIDSRGDVIVEYYTIGQDGTRLGHLARCGLDGTLKHETTIPQNRNFMYALGEYQSSPLKYYQWKINSDQNLVMYLLDENFEQTDSYVFNKNYFVSGDWEEFRFDFNRTFVIPDGDDVLLATAYIRNPYTPDSERGAAVARYELRTMQQKNFVKINDFQSQYEDPRCLCFERATDGSLYFVFREYGDAMTVVKMDGNFNIIWKRYTPAKPYLSIRVHSSLLYDEQGHEKGIYVVGYNRDNPVSQLCYFFLTDESLVNGIGEQDGIRPYSFYPNPTQNELHLQYSPDIQPKQIELYDLQGRLVQTQSKGLESLNMAGLPAGTYTMRVMLEDGTVFSDKVVKE